MIFTKYLLSEIFKNQLFVLLILFVILFAQKIIRVFDVIISANVPKCLIFVFFGLSIPEIIKLILPISLFFGILITFNYLYINNEIVAMYSCGLGKLFIVRSVFYISVITTIVSIVNVVFLSPFCARYQNYLMVQHQSNFEITQIFEKKFHFFKHINSVFFVNSMSGKKFQDIFLIKVIPNNYSVNIIVADSGYIEKFFDGTQWFFLHSGYYYSWNSKNIFLYSNFCINNFDQYKILINVFNADYRKSNDFLIVTEMSIYELWKSSMFEARAELHWRLTLIVVGLIMVMIIFPLSLMKLNSNYLLNVFPAMMLYLIFFLLQIFLRSNLARGNIEPLWIWLVNVCYIFIGIMLIFWDSVFFRNFRWQLKKIN